jgi:hypothetical protein
MAFADMFRKKYTANVWCNNCNSHSEVTVPKGVTITQFVESGGCPNCGCNTLVADYRQIEEFKGQRDQQQPRIALVKKIPRQQPVEQRQRAPVPEPRPSTRLRGYKPLPKAEEPDFSLKPASDFKPGKIFRREPSDLWTGEPGPERQDKKGDGYETY